MKRPIRQFLIFLGLLTILTLVRFPYDQYVQDYFKQLKRSARQNGIVIDAETFRFKFPMAVELNKFSAMKAFRLIPLSLFAEKVAVTLNPMSLFLFTAKFSSEVQAYSGLIKTSISKPLFSNTHVDINSNMENLQLSDFPPTKTYGFEGTFNGSFEGRILNQEGKSSKLSSALLSLILTQGKLESATKIYGLIPLPKTNDIEMNLKANLNDHLIRIETFTFFSSLGSVVGDGEISLTDSQTAETMDIKLEIKLTTEGASSIAPYLALRAKRPPPEGTKDWELVISKNAEDREPSIEAIAKNGSN